MLEELMSITPKNLNAAFLINSGAEAIENAIKICMRSRPTAKYGVSFTGAFHGRTTGALSLTNSTTIQKQHYASIPTKRLPFSEEAPREFKRLLEQEVAPSEIGFVILEHVQGEGGYRPAAKKMVKEMRRLCKQHQIPYIADEVQAGMGRTGKWWAWQHYNITPDVMTTAKALQVAATIANKKRFPTKPGSISSTWGGGHTIDLVVGIETIKIIKKQKLLQRNKIQGDYINKRLREIKQGNSYVLNPRGLGLMQAFDLPTQKMRDNVIIECLKKGLILLGCGKTGIRLIPPYIIEKQQIDEGLTIIEKAINTCSKKGFKHKGHICAFVSC